MRERLDEIAEHHDRLIESGADLGELTPVTARVKPNAGTVYSTRYSNEEIALIREAAKTRGMNASAFIRAAALAAAYSDLDLESAARMKDLTEIQALVQRLNDAVEHFSSPRA